MNSLLNVFGLLHFVMFKTQKLLRNRFANEQKIFWIAFILCIVCNSVHGRFKSRSCWETNEFMGYAIKLDRAYKNSTGFYVELSA